LKSAIEEIERKPTIWIHAFARSGSSTVLSMVSENEGSLDPQTGKNVSRVFTLFEPCHAEDDVEPELAARGCPGLVQDLANCDFSLIRKLHGWNDIHSKRRGCENYDPVLASQACSGADLVAFKTISKAFETFNIQAQAYELLEQKPDLHLLDVIRDPRSIYSSWMTTWPFNDPSVGGLGHDISALIDICETYANNIDATHPRVHRIRFEDLINVPDKAVQAVYDSIGIPFGQAQKSWIRKTFNAADCPGVDEWIAPYSDCHTKSDKSLEKWRDSMTEDEKLAFQYSPACVKVATVYGYPIE